MMWIFRLVALLTVASIPLHAEFCFDYPINGEASVAYDYFRSIPEGSWEGNQGSYLSAQFWAPLPLNDNGVGIHTGISYGLYDWAGRGSSFNHLGTLQQQLFYTLAIYRITPCEYGFNGAVAFDLMYNRRIGVFGLNATFSQARAQIGYLVDGSDEYGIWGTIDTNTAHEKTEEIPVSLRAISQANLFWRHYFEIGAESMIWVGMPYKKSLINSSGRAGSFLAGFSLRAPLTEGLSIDCRGSYMGPRSHDSDRKFQNYAANICIGLVYAFGTGCPDETPYLPMANNSNFISDASLNY